MDIDDLQGLTTTKVTTLRQSQGYNELPDREKKNFVTNMHHGVYNVTVQYDNNCVEYKTIELNQPQPITIIPNTISTTCGTSTVNYLKLEVNGGNGPLR